MPYPSVDWPQGPETGRTIADRYVVLERIASSRTGAVYLARDAADPSRRYVIKQLSTIALFRADERREAARRLRAVVDRWRDVEHEALVGIHDLILGERAHYVVMDAIPGLSFRQIIASPHLAVSPDLARNWGRQICALLTHLHTLPQPMYAPFLSPGHAMVTPDGTVRIVDLGLSHLFTGTDPTYGPYGTIKGYAAPELDTAPLSPTSDVYAVGRLLYALLAGVLLEEGTRGAPSLQRAVPGISRKLVRTIARAAHRDADQRFATAQDLDTALADGAADAPEPMSDWIARAR
ncbi:MAG: serine/threonine protein kinase, partial [Anaerolineae bacterium]